jgi:predicted  nucleic acid-binding Zn-ribbon protein
MPMPSDVPRDLHRIHRRLSELRYRLDHGPKQVAAREIGVGKLEQAIAAAHENAQQARIRVDQKQLELKTSENRIADWKAKLNACSSNKEYQALLDQIAAAEMANSVLEDEILEGLDKIEAVDREHAEAQRAFAAGKEDLARLRTRVTEEAGILAEEIAALERERAEVEKNLPPDFRADYERIVKARGADALAPVEDGVCTGCGQQITLNMENDLQLGKTILCRACGRLVYLPDEV